MSWRSEVLIWGVVLTLTIFRVRVTVAQLDPTGEDNSTSKNPICAGTKCKPKPTAGDCFPRNATTLTATSIYGEKRICCPVWACTHPNATTTLHYGLMGAKVVKKLAQPLNKASLVELQKIADRETNETCSALRCLEGSPSPKCRRFTPPAVKSLMKIEKDCCVMWTCAFGGNGSLYYIHPGMVQHKNYWKTPNGDDTLPVTDPPPITTTTLKPNTKHNVSKVILDVPYDNIWGSRIPTLTKSVSTICVSVSCIPPAEELKCTMAKSPISKSNLKMMGLWNNCCPLYYCSGATKTYLSFFGMYHAQPASNFSTTENPSASMSPVDPDLMSSSTTTTTTMAPQTTTMPIPVATAIVLEPATTTTTAAPTTTTTITTTTTTPEPTTHTTTLEPTTTTTTTPEPTTTTSTTTTLASTTTTTTPVPLLTTSKPVEFITPKPNFVTNSSSKNPGCRNMKCFPIPPIPNCVQTVITDCDLIEMFGDAVDCCQAYKCPVSSNSTNPGKAEDAQYLVQFGVSDGVSESVSAYHEGSKKPPNPQCSKKPDPNKSRPLMVELVLPEKEKPVMIFDVKIQKEKMKWKKIQIELKYIPSCSESSLCFQPTVDEKLCHKLPKGSVPLELKAYKVTDTCCGIWKCANNATLYGITQFPSTTIPVEFKGIISSKLPKYLTLKDPVPLIASNACPDVLCSPPLQTADCKVAASDSVINIPKGSLRSSKECCPLWDCRRKDGSSIIMYGRTNPKGYETKPSSILQGQSYNRSSIDPSKGPDPSSSSLNKIQEVPYPPQSPGIPTQVQPPLSPSLDPSQINQTAGYNQLPPNQMPLGGPQSSDSIHKQGIINDPSPSTVQMEGDPVPVQIEGGDPSAAQIEGDPSPIQMEGDPTPIQMEGDQTPVQMDGDASVVQMDGDTSPVQMEGELPPEQSPEQMKPQQRIQGPIGNGMGQGQDPLMSMMELQQKQMAAMQNQNMKSMQAMQAQSRRQMFGGLGGFGAGNSMMMNQQQMVMPGMAMQQQMVMGAPYG